MTSVMSICPAIIKLNVIATPSFGTRKTEAATKNAPNNPPTQAIAGASRADVKLPSEMPEIKMYANSAAVPTRNEIKAERIGLSTKPAILLFTAACVGIIAPARSARKRYR